MTANIATKEGPIAVEVAEIFTVDGHCFFVHYSEACGWKMSEWSTGHCVVQAADLPGDLAEDEITQAMVKEFGIAKVTRVGPEKVEAGIAKALAEVGLANEASHA